MGENPYKAPTDDRATGTDGRLMRVWRRFLVLIEELGSRVSAIEEILPGIAPGPPLARILVEGNDTGQSGAADDWITLPFTSVIAETPPVNIELLNGAIYYRNDDANNLYLTLSAFLDNVSLGDVELGFRRNGNDSTIVPQKVAQDRPEFAASYFGVCDVVDGDHIEAVVRFSSPQANYTYEATMYANHTGFAPNGD